MNSENKLNFQWTRYLFLLANVLVVLGLCLSWVYTNSTATSWEAPSEGIKYLPILLCNLAALNCWFACFYYEGKELQIIKTVMDKKIMNKYLWVNIFFFIYVFASIITFAIVNGIAKNPSIHFSFRDAYIVATGLTIFLSLISVAFEAYVIFKIQLEISKRKGPKEDNGKTIFTDLPASTELPTSGLSDNAGKE